MSTLIPNRQLNELRAMTTDELRRMRACEVFDGDPSKDENFVYTHLPHNPHDGIVADRIRIRAEQLGVQSNSIYPPLPLPAVLPVSPTQKIITHRRHGRRSRKA